MLLKVKICDGCLTEYLAYQPTEEDIKGNYSEPVTEEEYEEDEEFIEYLSEKYESELRNAAECGYYNFNDYLDELKY